jgi:hypothetical protein
MQTVIREYPALGHFYQGVAHGLKLLGASAAIVKPVGVIYLAAAVMLECQGAIQTSTIAAAILTAFGALLLLGAEEIEQAQTEMTLARLAP